MGSIRSPLWRHGGTTHGPQPRDYSYKLPRKMLLGALRSALSAKLRDGELRVVQEFSLADHKTKAMRAVLDALEARQDGAAGRQRRESQSGAGRAQSGRREAGGDQGRQCLRSAGPRQVLLSEAAAKKLVGGAREMTIYEVIKRPIVTEKGVAKKDSRAHAVF